MVAKMLLPVYGGTPAVWTVCMFFFQFLLLIAYGYAWVLSYFCGRYWRFVHTGLVIAAWFFLPLNFIPVHAADAPDLGILRDLTSQLGLPLLVVAASAPLLQFAYSQSLGKQAHDPYFYTQPATSAVCPLFYVIRGLLSDGLDLSSSLGFGMICLLFTACYWLLFYACLTAG